MNTTCTPRELEWSAALVGGLVEIRARQVAGFWLFFVFVAGEPLPDGVWERAGSTALN